MNISITNDLNDIKELFDDNSVNILISGDFCPNFRVSDLIKEQKFSEIYNDFLPFLRGADISITNLECPLVIDGNPITKRGPVLRGPVETVDALKFGGFNLASLANNHIRDHGESGLNDTIQSLKNGDIDYVGAGKTIEEARAPAYFNLKDIKIAIISIAEYEFSIATNKSGGAAPLDEIENYYQILEAKKNSDFLILIIHGGHEFYPLPSPQMTKVYRFFSDLGVDAIVGHHAHVFTGYEVHNNVPIFYNIGNFLFDRRGKPNNSWNEGFAVILSFRSSGIENAYMIPYTQNHDVPGVHLLPSEKIKYFSDRILEYNSIIANKESLSNKYNAFLNKQKIYYLSTFLGLNKYYRKLLKLNLFSRFFVKKKSLINNINHLRCQSHRDAITEILKSETGII